MGIPEHVIDEVTAREAAEMVARERDYRRGVPATPVRGKTTVVVDDGLATGSTMHAAVVTLRHEGAERVVVASPTGSGDTCRKLRLEADDLVCMASPEPFVAVSQSYDDFSP